MSMQSNQQRFPNSQVPKEEPEFAAYVGVDWGDRNSAWCLQVSGSGSRESGVLASKPEPIEQWAVALHHRFSGRPVAVVIEQSRGRVVYQLSKFPHLVLFVVHPNTAKNFRQALYPSGSKSDPVDSEILLELLSHRDHLHRLEPETEETRLLQSYVEERRRLVDDKTRCSNRLTNALKLYFPQLLDWISDIDSPLGCDWIQRWPTLEALQSCHPGRLHRFFLEHNCRSKERMRQRIEQIYAAVPAITDRAIGEAGASTARHCALVIQALQKGIEELDKAIEALVQSHPETRLFRDLPGAGKALLPRLIVAFGTQRDRYRNVEQFQAYCGIAPVTQQSGAQRLVHWRYCCPKFLRQTFQEWAAHSIQKCAWARAFYQLQRSRHKKHHAALRALAFKWIRILYRCWLLGEPYDEQLYLRSLAKRNSPLAIAPTSLPTQLQWQTVAGFSRLVSKKT